MGKYNLKKHIKLESIYKNGKKTVIKLGGIEIEKQKKCQHKISISINNIDLNKIVVSNKASFGKKKDFKYFTGYKDARK